jgi:hypothetical protein
VPTKLKRKFDMILAREQRMARFVALQAIRPKPFSVWEVMIPVIFILGFMRSREQREIFAQNLMFTKRMALDAAYEMLSKNQTKEMVMGGIAAKTQDLLSTIPDGLYSEAIRQKQMNEMDLLVDHYCRLMDADGSDYAALVGSTYPTPNDLAAFLDSLGDAERAVTQAARETLGSQTDDEKAERIEKAVDQFRQQEIEAIYSRHT